MAQNPNILEDIGVGRNSFFVLSPTDYNPGIWYDPQQLRMSIGGRGPLRRGFRDAYIWDMYRLAESIGEPLADGSGHYTISPDLTAWHPIWLQGFKDDAANNLYKAINTPFAVDFLATPQFDQEYYTIENFRFSPLVAVPISDDEGGPTRSVLEQIMGSETYDAETALYKAMVIPGYPLLIGSSLPAHSHYGPVLLGEATIGVRGGGKLGAVEVSMTFQGSKSLKLPQMSRREPEQRIVFPINSTANIPIMPLAPEETLPQAEQNEPSLDYVPYRTANILDCRELGGIYSIEDSVNATNMYLLQLEAQDVRLVSMELRVSQTLDWEHTQPTVDRTQACGARFGAVKGRRVSGSLTFYSRTMDFEFVLGGEYTLYFGGVWLFPMSQVVWQRPTVEATPGEGYLHTYNFIALASENTTTKPVFNSGLPASEFYLAPTFGRA